MALLNLLGLWLTVWGFRDQFWGFEDGGLGIWALGLGRGFRDLGIRVWGLGGPGRESYVALYDALLVSHHNLG